MSDALRRFADEIVFALTPLADASRDPQRLGALLADLGWQPATPPQPLLDLAAAGASLLAVAGAEDDTVDLAAVLDAIRQLVSRLVAVGSLPDASFPTDVDAPTFRATIARDLLDYLLVEHLLRNRHAVGAVLRLAGILRLTEVAAAGRRQSFLRRAIAWDAIGTLLTDPASGFRQAFGWGSATPALSSALGTVGSLLETLGLEFRYGAADDALASFLDAGATDPASSPPLHIDLRLADTGTSAPAALSAGVRLALRAPTASRGDAIALMPYANAAITQDVTLGPGATLSVRGDADFTKGVALTLAPSTPLALDSGFLGGTATSPANAHVEFALAADSADAPRVLLGTREGSRLTVGALRVAAGVKQNGASPEASIAIALDRARLVIKPDPDEGDSFLGSLLGDDGVALDVSFGVTLSSATGLHFTSAGGLSARLPVDARLGPVQAQAISLAVAPQSGGVDAEIGASLRADIGPVAVQLDGVGLRLAARFPDPPLGNLGPVDLAIGFRSPSGVGLSLDASGVVTGGGFLQHDPATGTYAGVMKLSLHDELTLTAYGLIATRLPDGKPGYSLLVFITADGFQPIPLGLGFMLTSIGGLIGVNRTFDYDVLRAGLKTDTLATLLFPRDPVGNAPALIQALASAFPARAGSFLLGLLARITWFTPTLITLDLGLVLEVGSRTRLLVLGRVTALLPSADNDLVRLILDTVGEVDFDAGTLAIDAMLVDSRLVHRFPITGSAAVRARWGNQAGADGQSFLLSVGGFNPRFAPPAGFPALERVAIALTKGKNPRLVCESYFAITSNTLQFGARASLYAEAIGFSVTGEIGYDVLVSWAPLHFVADFQGMVQLKRGSHSLFKLALKGTLEGPQPLRLSGKVTFEILWVSFTVRIDATLADGPAGAGLAAVNVADLLAAAVGTPANWRTQRTPGVAHGVALRAGAASSSGPVLDPLGQMVFEQQVVPLNLTRDVEVYGGAPVVGPKRFGLSGKLNETPGVAMQGAFAPARYFALSDDEKLTAPSFERMDAGVVLGDLTVRYAAAAIEVASLEYAPITLNPEGTASAPEADTPYQLPAASLATHVATGAAARAPARQISRARFRTAAGRPAATVSAPEWKIVRTSDGAAAPVDPSLRTWSEQRAALDQLNRGGSVWTMVPTHELAVA